ncbi:MAG: lysophospholipid acyltransferase family protein [Gammaproteobacteria bacterium]|jgi:1-acyl-sn-glycerol-3-phosphate acyltransferase|nr:lysophospholipid acyltransferase family protein [Gammaproteobacteria bacterium]
MKALRFMVFNLLSWVMVPVWGLGVLLVGPFSPAAGYAIARNWCVCVVWLARVLCGLSYRVVGAERFPPAACVIFIKHSSAFETILQLVEFPRACWVLKRELLWVPIFGWTLIALRAIAINRGAGGAAVKQVVSQGSARLAEGICVAVFPEGTRMPAGTTRRYGKSGTLLAQASGRLIVPVAHNAGYLWPRRGFGITPGEVVFSVGEPVDPANRNPAEVNEQIQAWVEAEVARIVAGDI